MFHSGENENVLYLCSLIIAASHMRLFSILNVASATKELNFKFNFNNFTFTVDPWTTQGVNPHITYSPSSVSLDSNNHRLCSTVVFTIEKYLRISGPSQFKPTLFKGQL